MATTEQLGLRVEEWAKAVAHDGALEAVTSATGTGVVAAPSSEEAREMILWLIGRLRWERQLDSLQRRSPTSGARACS